MAKAYEFRTLTSKDLFLIIKLVKKIGLDELAKVFEMKNIKSIIDTSVSEGKEDAEGTEYTDDNIFTVGLNIMLDIAQIVVERLDCCENEIYDVLSATSNLDKKQVQELDLDVFIEMIIDFVQLEDFHKLFTKVASLFKSEK